MPNLTCYMSNLTFSHVLGILHERFHIFTSFFQHDQNKVTLSAAYQKKAQLISEAEQFLSWMLVIHFVLFILKLSVVACNKRSSFCLSVFKNVHKTMENWLTGSSWPGWLAGWLAGWMDGWLVGWLVGWLAGWLVGWMDGWMAGWLAGWLVGWLPIIYGHLIPPETEPCCYS